ncbi:restriction endonuclease subunit S [Listeria booriae]|uniref:Restriction endonuclease subunit S n=1 Tax=Listeria booriae TaxID=1552123 RepID=A0A842F506_9LIST|nr:restriction endonuclease subunit S [Listeria booriae]MBC2240032.1 restriction endonuclease subunit S [Listeria booriae]
MIYIELQAWEQRKLGDIVFKAVDNRGKTPPLDVNGPHPLLEVVSLGQGYPDYSKVTKYVNTETYNSWFRNHIKENDALFSTVGNTGLVSIMDDFMGATIAQNIVAFRAHEQYSSRFFYTMMQLSSNQKKIKKIEMGAVQPSIKVSQLIHVYFNVSTEIEEQIKIGHFFKLLDNIIALHQRKLDALKQMKKGFLQQLFPESGEKLPRARFTGFQEEWEQREFGDILIFSVPNNNFPRASLNYEEGIIKNIHYGDVLMKFDSVVDVSTSNIPFVTNGQLESFTNQFLQNGDIVIADTAEDKITGKAIEVCGINNTSVVSGLHTMVARPNISFASCYLGYYLNSYSYRKQLLPLMQGIKVLSISKSNISKTTLCFPKNVIEQERIGDFFKQLDKTMLLHQNRLTKLTTLKKAYLKIMFI